jgi:hypothetical protein
MAPILRGAQVGTYWNGTASVPCTFFGDDCNWNDITEYTQTSGTWAFDTANGYLSHNTPGDRRMIHVSTVGFTDGVYEAGIIFKSVASGYDHDMLMLWDNSTVDTSHPKDCVQTYINPNDSKISLQYIGADGTAHGITSYEVIGITLAANTQYFVRVTYISAIHSWTIQFFDAAHNQVYTKTGTYTPTWSGGFVGLGHNGNSTQVVTTSLIVNALESTSTNGVAVTIGGVPHGARYDTQEYAGFVFTNPLKSADAKLKIGSKCTLTANLCPVTMEFKNATDATSLSTLTEDLNRDLIVGAASDNKTRALDIEPLILDTPDIGDSLSLAVKRKNYALANDNQNAVFIDPKFVVLSQEG